MPVKSSEIKAEPRRWFRFYAESINDPKVQRLTPHLFKTWVNLLCLASSNGGRLPRRDDIAFQLRISDHDAQCQIDELISAGLIDILPDKSLEPHNWKARQYVSDTSKDRTRKYREKKVKQPCDVTVTPEVTPPDAEADTDTDSHRIAQHQDAPREEPAAALPEVSDLKKLSDRLFAVAEPCLASQAIAPGLASMMVPQMWLDQGCDLDRDVVPAIDAIVKRGRRGVATWDYFTRPVAEAKAKRLAGLPAVGAQAGSFARRPVDYAAALRLAEEADHAARN